MLLIECPWCGPRDESEFSYSGEAHIVRPKDPFALSDEEWADYLFNRKKPPRPASGTVVSRRRVSSLFQTPSAIRLLTR